VTIVPNSINNLPSEPFRSSGQAAALVVSEAQAFLAQLFPQDPVLFPKVLDEKHLSAVHPAGQRDHNEPEWVQEVGHSQCHYRCERLRRSDLP